MQCYLVLFLNIYIFEDKALRYFTWRKTSLIMKLWKTPTRHFSTVPSTEVKFCLLRCMLVCHLRISKTKPMYYSLPWLSTTSIPTLGYDNFKDELVWVNLIPLKISEKLIFRIICFPTTSQLFLTTMILKTKSLKKICASKTPGSSLMVALALTGSCWVF